MRFEKSGIRVDSKLFKSMQDCMKRKRVTNIKSFFGHVAVLSTFRPWFSEGSNSFNKFYEKGNYSSQLGWRVWQNVWKPETYIQTGFYFNRSWLHLEVQETNGCLVICCERENNTAWWEWAGKGNRFFWKRFLHLNKSIWLAKENNSQFFVLMKDFVAILK